MQNYLKMSNNFQSKNNNRKKNQTHILNEHEFHMTRSNINSLFSINCKDGMTKIYNERSCHEQQMSIVKIKFERKDSADLLTKYYKFQIRTTKNKIEYKEFTGL